MNQWRPLRVLCVGLQDNFGRVVTTNIQRWGHNVIVYPDVLTVEGHTEENGRSSLLEGDILLYDLDASFRAWRSGESGSGQQRGMHASQFEVRGSDAPLKIALSSRSVSRSMLEQIGAVALLQKPFEMRHLQRYLSILQRLLFTQVEKQSFSHEKVRVLVVDDDAGVAHAIRQCLLYESGYEVAVAYDGLEALEQWLDWQPECIVTDLIMPWMNGYQVMRCVAIGAQDMLPGFVVMSALTSLENTRDRSYLEERSVAYVDKPFHVEHLLSAIKHVCVGQYSEIAGG